MTEHEKCITETNRMDAELQSLREAVGSGDVVRACSCVRLTFHEIYDLSIVGKFPEERKIEILKLFQNAAMLSSDSAGKNIEVIRDRLELLKLLFERGDISVHNVLRERIKGN